MSVSTSSFPPRPVRAFARGVASALGSLLRWPGHSLRTAATYRPRAGDDQELRQVLAQVRARDRQPAMAAALVRSSGTLARAVAGETVQGGGVPVELGHRFHIGSIAKSFTAMLVAQLVEEERLRYDAPLCELFPDVGCGRTTGTSPSMT